MFRASITLRKPIHQVLFLKSKITHLSTMGGGDIGQMAVDTSARITALRHLMRKVENELHAYIIPTDDQHASEYVADCDARRAYISGFTGSAGVAIVSLDQANLFTDGRYFLQASQQLDSNWHLQKQGLKDVPTWQEYLEKVEFSDGARIGVDPTLISASEAKSLSGKLGGKGMKLVPIMKNLVDQVWGSSRPPRPASKIYPLDIKYTGQSSTDKLTAIRKELEKHNAFAIVVNMLDEVAWLFNLRASDIAFNPVFFAYAIVTKTHATLFLNENQIDGDVLVHLGPHVSLRPYDEIFSHIEELRAMPNDDGDSKILLSKQASWALLKAIGEDGAAVVSSPIADAKAIKNAVEIEGFRQCHIRDGAALAQYFSWLEEQLNNGAQLTESQVADKLESFRSKLDSFKGLSFPTISSTGPNGAIIHYAPDPNNSAIVRKDQLYLCDSGGQYFDGTTDVTRTWHFGTPTTREIRAFTRVLQGHIAIDTTIFPEGTSGFLIDVFARRALWQDGLGEPFDGEQHGTGHGVGHFLNVHEGPQGIGTRIAYNDISLKVGMTLSNEPGYYADNEFGIRIENVCIVKKAETPNHFEDRGYLTFEHLTMCPIDSKLVDVELLTKGERDWLNNYHAEVIQKVKPLLVSFGDTRAVAWLERECQPI
ncbi:hypothetical protein BS47DRAFT_1294380 [Hydnum rufescens UP504]|uniref:Creatinase/aminopeptidase n=1 Tax=Hydnum rufescens UP504 TaxID=1448309 RepID=A0A9P6B0K2_9AGAM|nr:hypothetical protein BS47DRAFT_1294380 [Hydnum rufescens UP504]